MVFNDSTTDEELMRAYQNGIDGAFDLLFKRHSSRVYGFLMNQLKNRVDADDVFQATFLKLHQSRRLYDPAFLFAPWLFTVCKSVLVDHRRKRIRIKEDSNDETVGRAIAETDPGAEIFPLAVNGLAARERAVIEMRYKDDLSFEEIARRLKTSPMNARKILSRGIKSLRILTGKKGEEL